MKDYYDSFIVLGISKQKKIKLKHKKCKGHMFNTLRVLEYQFKDTFPIEFKRWENQMIYLIIITFERKKELKS